MQAVSPKLGCLLFAAQCLNSLEVGLIYAKNSAFATSFWMNLLTGISCRDSLATCSIPLPGFSARCRSWLGFSPLRLVRKSVVRTWQRCAGGTVRAHYFSREHTRCRSIVAGHGCELVVVVVLALWTCVGSVTVGSVHD